MSCAALLSCQVQSYCVHTHTQPGPNQVLATWLTCLAAQDRLVDEGYNPSYGARPLRRAITRLLEDSMAEQMLRCAHARLADVHLAVCCQPAALG